MANEFYWKLQGRYSPANSNTVPHSVGTIEYRSDQSGVDHEMGTQEIGTSEENITWSTDIGDEYWLYIRNLDTTNYVQLGFATGVYGIRLRAGDFMLIPLEPGTSIFALANTAACQVQYAVYEA